MFTHDFNVYETLSRLDTLLGGDHDLSSMDRAETIILTNKLVHGAVELLSHLAIHNILAFETATFYRSIHEVAAAKYDQAQLDAWAPKVPEPDRWLQRLSEYETFVADNDAGKDGGMDLHERIGLCRHDLLSTGSDEV